MEIGVAEILLRDDEIGIESGCQSKFVDGPVPLVLQRIGSSQVVVRPGLVRRFQDRIRPERKLVPVEVISLVGEEGEEQGQR